jgi:hypothetical protein
MSRRLKRNEGWTEGLQRVSKELFRDLLQAMGQEKLTSGRVHDARKIIKICAHAAPDTRSDEARGARNRALRNLGVPPSGPRDAVVTLGAFENVYKEGLNGTPLQRLSRAGRHCCTSPYQRKHAPWYPSIVIKTESRKFGAWACCYPSRMPRAVALAGKSAAMTVGTVSSRRACEQLTVRAED